MQCPHCSVYFHDDPISHPIGYDLSGLYEIQVRTCPSCKMLVLHLANYDNEQVSNEDGDFMVKRINSNVLFYPRIVNRQPLAPEVPFKYAQDFTEACLVLSDSPKASAALSRRCLQNIIRDHLKIEKKDLSQEIQVIIDSRHFPNDILESIDSIRNIGNFAAHPIKSISTGEIVDVEPNEAEWNLDVLEMIFDYLFIRPSKIMEKKDLLNKKLKDAGKPEMK